MSPASICSFTCMIVTPVCVSPWAIAQAIGAAPRYLGSSDGWIFSVPRDGSARTGALRNWPKSATTTISGARDRNCSTTPGALTFSGVRTGIERSPINERTGQAFKCWRRPLGRSGCVTTATTAWLGFPIRASSAGQASWPDPIKTILINLLRAPIIASPDFKRLCQKTTVPFFFKRRKILVSCLRPRGSRRS